MNATNCWPSHDRLVSFILVVSPTSLVHIRDRKVDLVPQTGDQRRILNARIFRILPPPRNCYLLTNAYFPLHTLAIPALTLPAVTYCCRTYCCDITSWSICSESWWRVRSHMWTRGKYNSLIPLRPHIWTTPMVPRTFVYSQWGFTCSSFFSVSLRMFLIDGFGVLC